MPERLALQNLLNSDQAQPSSNPVMITSAGSPRMQLQFQRFELRGNSAASAQHGSEADVRSICEQFRGIAASWYTWQRVYLWARHRRPGNRERAPKKWETEAEVFWGARPPQMVDDRTMSFAHPSGEFFYYLSEESSAYYLDLEERGTRKHYWMFRHLEDAEKYILCALCDATQAMQRTDTLRQRWIQSGLDPRVQLSYNDIDRFPGRVSLTVDQEPIDRGWMGKDDAIAFSHPILLTVEELREVVRAEFPDEAFRLGSEKQ